MKQTRKEWQNKSSDNNLLCDMTFPVAFTVTVSEKINIFKIR